MNMSITKRITVYLMAFSIVLIGTIALAVAFILPSYYRDYQLSIIEDKTKEIKKLYDMGNVDEVLVMMDDLKSDVGGEIYVQTSDGQMNTAIGMGNGSLGKTKGQKIGTSGGSGQKMLANSEKFIPEGKVTYYNYVNKVGLEIYALGVEVDSDYVVYEVSIHSLDDAVAVVLPFFVILLLVVLVLAFLVSLVLSRTIAKPIRDLNRLAKHMKDKKIKAAMVVKSGDEIGELNQSLNALYEELLASIYHLESELKRERVAENLKKRFLAQATHELKTPIAVIGGYAEILYDGMYKDEDDRDRYLKNIYDETRSMSHLIGDVLDYTKMETGNYQLEKEEVKVYKFFTELAARYEALITEKALEYRREIDIEEECLKEIDRNRIEQVLKNLLSNGAEHGHSYVSLRITGNESKLIIQVENDGPTINEEDLPFIFDSFYKKKGKKSGSGLGLAIVKEIVNLHGGDYRAENINHGVKFTVVL